MFEFRQSVTVRRPPEAVFDLLTRFEEIPKFVPQVTSAEQMTPGPVSVGTTFVQRGRMLGRTIATPTVVTILERSAASDTAPSEGRSRTRPRTT